ncbi:MAG: hypothetical protein HQL56_17345 [Magnetococcales bacterium]|nr:hypothetical protein [Magnetococcales bacterium]
MKLKNGSRVGIVGGGPAGSMAGFFLMELAGRVGLELQVDIYEARDFSRYGPAGCNMCAGVVSESLVQTLAAEGINLPPLVVQRGIESYVLHTSNLEPVAIPTPADDLRIATVYRGSGPMEPMDAGNRWASFDGFLLDLAREKGVQVIHDRVMDLSWDEGLPCVHTRGKLSRTYDLIIGAVGVNSATLQSFENLGIRFKPPLVNRGYLSEIHLGLDVAQRHLGSAMHIFLLDIPNLKFAALIPKVEYVTVCLLGKDIDKVMVQRFMDSPEVKSCFPVGFEHKPVSGPCCLGEACHCTPRLNLGPAVNPYGDRVVLVGDSAISRLYKDGIGAAYVTAKSCAVTAIFLGISTEAFQEHYWPVCHRIARDNHIGNLIFRITALYQHWRFLRRGMVNMVRGELSRPMEQRVMSRVLWDTFTGSATYREIFLKSLQPRFLWKLFLGTMRGLVDFSKRLSPS